MTPLPVARQTIKRCQGPAPGILSAAAISQTKLHRIVPSHKHRRKSDGRFAPLDAQGNSRK
jgi:hypothetical protein